MENIITNKEKIEEKILKRELLFKNLKVGLTILAIILVSAFWAYRFDLFTIKNPKTVAVINFNEEITSQYVTKTVAKLDELAFNDDIKEILFIMNSPGGSPSASEELSAYLKQFIKVKPITMYVEGVAASGGYYIASAIKPLYSNKNAIVGSIGVIMPHYSFQDLAEFVGVKEDYIAAGKFKKPMSMFKDVDQETKEYIQASLLQPTYRNFIAAVAENRNLPVETIEKFAEGQIYVANNESIKGILVDEISTLIGVKHKLNEKYGKDVLFLDTNGNGSVLDMLKSNIDKGFNMNSILNQFVSILQNTESNTTWGIAASLGYALPSVDATFNNINTKPEIN